MPKPRVRRLAPEIINTEHNDAAVRYLEAARKSLDATNRRFADLIGTELGVPISENVMGYYLGVKSRRQPVPAAILVAAARLSGLPLLDENQGRSLGERLAKVESWMTRVEALLQHLVPPGATGPHLVSGS